MAYAYPPKIDIRRPLHDSRFTQIYYYIGLSLEALGNKKEAQEYYQKAANEKAENSIYLYYQGLAFKKLNNDKKAANSFKKLGIYAKEERKINIGNQFDFRGESEQDWLADKCYKNGLYYLGNEKKNEAKLQFTKAVELNPIHLWANFMLKEEF